MILPNGTLKLKPKLFIKWVKSNPPPFIITCTQKKSTKKLLNIPFGKSVRGYPLAFIDIV